MANKKNKNKNAPVKVPVAKEAKPEEKNVAVVSPAEKPAKKNDNKPANKTGKNGKPRKTAKEFFLGIKAGIKSILSELKKVTWPKFGAAAKNTGIVLVVVLIFLVVCLGIDLGLTGIFSAITK